MSFDNRVSAAKNAADNQLYIFPINQVYIQVFQFILVSHYLFLYFFIYYSKFDKDQTFIFVRRRSCLSDTKHFMINM